MASSDKTGSNAIQALFKGKMDMEEMEEVLKLYRTLSALNAKALKPGKRFHAPGGDEAEMRLKEGFTLLQPIEIMPSERAMVNRAAEILDVLRVHSDHADGNSRASGLLDEKGLFRKMVENYLVDGEERFRDAGVIPPPLNPEIALFTVFNVLKGTFRDISHALGKIDTSGWEHGFCPVCGGGPAVAVLKGEGGKRYLICHRCETTWRFRRIMCPFCGNSDYEKLGFFTLEGGDSNLRVDFCNSCKGYIKTWDSGGDDNPNPEVEDLKTPGYDLAAEGEGYRRSAPNIFGVWVGFDVDDGDGPEDAPA
ncbi:MAG TPA: formate dehydrogenase accessory protein FdhE [Proteobacteria bacterium]|nr:formate dehydrogenase accessory protein FdhE [bacterium BMS3Abin14]HDL54191.1 formate dehydrogenase accessory protein FdhE [Pseudomonadota bacterium]